MDACLLAVGNLDMRLLIILVISFHFLIKCSALRAKEVNTSENETTLLKSWNSKKIHDTDGDSSMLIYLRLK